MTFGLSRFNKAIEWEMLRFCNKKFISVVGGASKLLKYFERNYVPKSLISYANLQWSDGGLYKSLGFVELKQAAPNYWWCKDSTVLTRYACQKHKLCNMFDDYIENEPEKVCMQRHGYYRVFDCGNKVFVKTY
jgi:hypothetical protein